jgi:uncharacterized membrane protein
MAFMLLTSIASAAPDENSSVLAWFLWNTSLIITSITSMFTSVMAVFMEPPLVVFIGLGIFAFAIGIVARYMAGRRN